MLHHRWPVDSRRRRTLRFIRRNTVGIPYLLLGLLIVAWWMLPERN